MSVPITRETRRFHRFGKPKRGRFSKLPGLDMCRDCGCFRTYHDHEDGRPHCGFEGWKFARFSAPQDWMTKAPPCEYQTDAEN